jgi:hypothetical protein
LATRVASHTSADGDHSNQANLDRGAEVAVAQYELDRLAARLVLLAWLFHSDGRNDVAPGGYDADNPAAGLPPSPLPAEAAPTGFHGTF